jgi:integrase
VSRRGGGEGSIYRRADGRWVCAIDLGYANGKRRRRVVYGRTRQEVAAELRRLQGATDAGLRVDRENQRLDAFAGVWMTETVRPRLRPKTIRTYETVLRIHILPALGHLPVARIRVQDVQAVLNARSRDGLSPRSVRMIRDVLRALLNSAARWGLVQRNVAALARRLRQRQANGGYCRRPTQGDSSRGYGEIATRSPILRG